MPESTDTRTTYEIAKSCPKCGHYGELQYTHPGPRGGSRVEVYLCTNEVCLWYETGWTIQINKDGSIPDRTKGPKQFPSLKVDDDAMQNYLDRLTAEDKGER